LLVGAFGCLIVPFFALQFWHRWMFMLVYPLTFYAIYGLAKWVNKSSFNGKLGFLAWSSNNKAKGMILIAIVLGVAYLVTPITMTYANKSVPNITRTQVYFSTDPAIPYQDVGSVIQAMGWLNANLNTSYCVILQQHFLTWGQLYLNSSHKIINYESDVNAAVNKSLNLNFSTIYFIWWNQPIDWIDAPIPSNFSEIQNYGRISVYNYSGVTLG
jgi:hypothetical protein